MYRSENPVEFLKNFPFSLIPEILGSDTKSSAKMKKKYKSAMERYRKEYYEALKMGITEKN